MTITVTRYSPAALVREMKPHVLELLYEEAYQHLTSGGRMKDCAERGCLVCKNAIAAANEAGRRRRFV